MDALFVESHGDKDYQVATGEAFVEALYLTGVNSLCINMSKKHLPKK